MNPQTKTTTLIGILIVLTIIAGLLLSLSNIAKQQRILSIGSFEECALAGYPVMESYPERCATPDGRTFTNEKQIPVSNTDGIQANGCAVGGCSAEVCGEASDAPIASNCIYRPEFACYKEAACERQPSGKCGWTPTPELSRCLANPPQLEAGVEVVN